MAEYQRVAKDPSYQPMEAITRGDAAASSAQKQIQQMRDFFESNRIVDQQRTEDARFAGQNWKALASLTQSGVEYYTEVAKQTAKDKATGEAWDAIFNPEFRSGDFETPVLQQAEIENTQVKNAADQLEANGQILDSEQIRNRFQGVGQGITNERALAQQLKNRYAGDLTALVNGDMQVRYNGVAVPINMLYNSGDIDKVNYALSRATAAWLEKNNAQFMTKDTLVKYLGETIPATMGYMATNVITSSVAQRKDELLAEVKTTGFNYGAVSDRKNVTQNFQSLAETLFNDNNGITTMDRANRVAAEVMLQGAATVSEDQVRIVGQALQKPNQANTELFRVAPLEYLKAIQEARSNKAKDDAAFQSQVINNTLAALKQMDPANLEGKLTYLEQQAGKLEEKGMYAEAQELRSKASVYTTAPEATANFLKYQKQIASGISVSDATISQEVAAGTLNPEQATTLRSQRNTAFKASLTSSASATTVQSRSFASNIALATGTVVDSASGEFKIGALSQPAINPMDLKTINKAFEKALRADLDRYALTLDPNMDPSELNDAMEKRAAAFQKAQLESPNGRFYLGGLFVEDKAAVRTPGTPEYERVRQAARNFNNLTLTKPAALPSGATNYSNKWNPGQGVSLQIKQNYKPGDRLLDPRETSDAKLDAEQGIFRPEIIRAARDLGLTPKQFIDQQVVASRLPPVNWNSAALKAADNPGALAETSMVRDLGNMGYKAQDVKPGREGYRATAVTGIPIFLSRGLSVQGASMLSAALYLRAQKTKVDEFNQQDFADKVLRGFTPQELKILRNPNATYRQIARITGFNAGMISYASALEQLFGIK